MSKALLEVPSTAMLLTHLFMGKTKRLIDELIAKKAQGNSFQEINIQMKLMFKGIDVKRITEQTPDDAATIAKIYEVAQAFQVQLTSVSLFTPVR